MNTRLLSVCLKLAAIVVALSVPRISQATTSGCVAGRLLMYQNQGAYCSTTAPINRSCDGATYTESQWHTYQAVADTVILIKDDQGRQVGAGTTNWSGDFAIPWTSSYNATSGYPDWLMQHKDNRFFVQTPDYATWYMTMHTPSLLYNSPWGADCNYPQQWGNFYAGGPAAPHGLANIYDGAWRTWVNSFQYVGYLQQYFNFITIRCCGGDGADGGGTGVRIGDDVNFPWEYGTVIAHELGHVASSQTSQGQNASACYNYSMDGGGWLWRSKEHACAAYEDAFANWAGDSGRYWEYAEGDFCDHSGTGPCSHMSEPNGRSDGCETGEGRWPESNYKFLWDIYDSHRDVETVQQYFTELFENHHYFSPGMENRQRDEAQKVTCNPICVQDLDGKSAYDYRMNYFGRTGVTVVIPYLYNFCQTVGD